MAQKSTTFIKITNQEVYDKLMSIEDKLDKYHTDSLVTKKIAWGALTISTFLAGTAIVWAMGG